VRACVPACLRACLPACLRACVKQQALGAPSSHARLTEVARRLAEGRPVSRASEARTLRFLIEHFDGALGKMTGYGGASATLRDDVELLRLNSVSRVRCVPACACSCLRACRASERV
jgi:hypothetical protein